VKIALGAVSPTPHLVMAANEFLEGKILDAPTADQAADLMLAKATAYEHNGYKIPIARTLIRRTLLQLIA
jgi:xanthine dehydrogenase YagS FAD-binding subunit